MLQSISLSAYSTASPQLILEFKRSMH